MNMRNLMIVAATPVFVTGTQNLMNDAMTWGGRGAGAGGGGQRPRHFFVPLRHFVIRRQTKMNVP